MRIRLFNTMSSDDLGGGWQMLGHRLEKKKVWILVWINMQIEKQANKTKCKYDAFYILSKFNISQGRLAEKR